jgi:hypothetical protein
LNVPLYVVTPAWPVEDDVIMPVDELVPERMLTLWLLVELDVDPFELEVPVLLDESA